MIRLIRHSPFPPGEFSFKQEGLLPFFFPAEGLDIYQQAKKVAAYRTANGLDNPDQATVVREIDAYTCVRLHNDPNWCYDTDQPLVVNIGGGGGCSSCGK